MIVYIKRTSIFYGAKLISRPFATFFGKIIFWSGAKQRSCFTGCRSVCDKTARIWALGFLAWWQLTSHALNYNLPYLDLPNLLRAHPIWRPYPHVRPQFGSKLGWIDLLQSIDEKKANAHLGRSFSDVFRWHKGHSQITLAIIKNGTELHLNQRFEYFLDHRKFSKVKMFLKPVWVLCRLY